MFEQATALSGRAPRPFWQTCVGVAGQALLLGGAVLAPIVSPQVLPRAMLTVGLVAPGAPPPPPPPGTPVVRPRGAPVVRQITLHGLIAPSSIPPVVARIIDPPSDSTGAGIPGGIAGGSEGGVTGGILPQILNSVPSPAVAKPVKADPTPEIKPANAAPIRVPVGGDVRMAETIYRPEPSYPPLARQARVSGTVQLEGVIGTDGRLKELRVVSGHPLLARAALEAVSQWIYKPTLLNGRPVEVIAPITVTFRLN
jgi:protein TonB